MYAHQKVVDLILEKLKQGTCPWRQTWVGGMSAMNYVTRKSYRGVNRLVLNMTGNPCPYYATFNQIKNIGGMIRKGEHALPIIYYDIKPTDENEGKGQKVVFKLSHVFNLSQSTLPLPDMNTDVIQFNPIEKAESILAGYQNPPKIVFKGQRAYYQPSTDTINMPNKNSFFSAELYYSALYHECIHSVGASHRLNREGISGNINFGSHEYSFEELIAEVGSAMLNNIAGISLIEESASYIKGWLSVLENDPMQILKASALAEKSVAYILGEYKANEETVNQETVDD